MRCAEVHAETDGIRDRPPPVVGVWAFVLGMLALGLLPAGAVGFAPIEGVWEQTNPPHGLTLIQESSPEHFQVRTIRGTVGCVPDENGFVSPVGVFDGEDIGSGLRYGGFDVIFSLTTCEPVGQGESVDTVTNTDPANYRKAFCASEPGSGPPQFDSSFHPTVSTTHCSESIRIRPPETPATFASITSLPRVPACNAAARRRGRMIKLRLKNPLNEPLLSVIVKLGGVTVLTYSYPASVPPVTRIKLPAGPRTLTISMTTTSGKTFIKKRRYGPCRKRHRRRHR